MEFDDKVVEFNIYDTIEYTSEVSELCSEDIIDPVTQNSLDLHLKIELILLPCMKVNKEKSSQFGEILMAEEKMLALVYKTEVLSL